MEFSGMKVLGIVLMGLLTIGIFSMASIPRIAHADDDTSFVDVDVSSTNFPNDLPYAISCNPDAVYMTIYNGGNLAKIDPVSKNVTIIQNPEGNSTDPRAWYSMTSDSNGHYWINERLTGRIWDYDPSGNGTWVSIPTLPELTEPAVSYPLGYDQHPEAVTVQTSEGPSTYIFNLNNFGDLLFANGQVLMGMSYKMEFDENSHNAGVADRSFSGLITVNPNTHIMTTHPINGTIAPTGLSEDSIDSNIVWVSDEATQNVYKYNLSNDTVEETYTLPARSNPKGVANDSDYVYVAMSQNYLFFPDGDSEITRISKSSGNQTIIDTTAPLGNPGVGTFAVYVVNGYLIWTDMSGHVGSINLSNDAKTYVDTVYANENHFGCQVGSDFWVAGHGSVKAGIIPLADLSPTIQPPTPGDSEAQASIQRLFNAPVQSALDNCMNLTVIESASAPYDYFHNGSRAYVEYMQFLSLLSGQTNPMFKHLTDLQKAWLFEKIKPDLDKSFWWIQDTAT